jgi:hypothetical protein
MGCSSGKNTVTPAVDRSLTFHLTTLANTTCLVAYASRLGAILHPVTSEEPTSTIKHDVLRMITTNQGTSSVSVIEGEAAVVPILKSWCFRNFHDVAAEIGLTATPCFWINRQGCCSDDHINAICVTEQQVHTATMNQIHLLLCCLNEIGIVFATPTNEPANMSLFVFTQCKGSRITDCPSTYFQQRFQPVLDKTEPSEQNLRWYGSQLGVYGSEDEFSSFLDRYGHAMRKEAINRFQQFLARVFSLPANIAYFERIFTCDPTRKSIILSGVKMSTSCLGATFQRCSVPDGFEVIWTDYRMVLRWIDRIQWNLHVFPTKDLLSPSTALNNALHLSNDALDDVLIATPRRRSAPVYRFAMKKTFRPHGMTDISYNAVNQDNLVRP